MAKHSASLTPTLNTQQLAAVVNEVAQSSPIAREAVSQACQRQADGIVRTRSATLYATAYFTATAAGQFAAGLTQDTFTVPIGQIGSGSVAALTKRDTNMTQAGLLASEAFSVEKLGISLELDEASGAISGSLVAEATQWIWQNTVAELQLGGQDVQILGLASQWADSMVPQITASQLSAGAVAPANTAFNFGNVNFGYDGLRDYDLFIPQQVPFKVKLTMPTGSAFANPLGAAAIYRIKVALYGTSVTAIQA